MFGIVKREDYDPVAYCKWDRCRVSASTASREAGSSPGPQPPIESPTIASIADPMDTLSISTGYGFEVLTCGGQPGLATVTYY